MRLLALGLLGLTVLPVGRADTRYVHDRVEVGVFENADLTGETVAIVTTGTPLEVLEHTDEKARVRIPSGGIGWVDARYLSADEPAAVLLLEFEAENQHLAQELEDTRRRVRQMGEQPVAAAATAAAAQAGHDILQARIERAIAVLRGLEPDEPRVDRVVAALAGLTWWAIGGIGAAILLFGVIIGRWWGVRSRASMRGGIRVQVRR
jgi:SH3 domain protein